MSTPTDPREGKPPFVMPLIHGLNCEKVCHERANGYLHAPDYDGPYDVDGLKYCGRCHTWLPETPEQLQATNSKLAAENAELKGRLDTAYEQRDLAIQQRDDAETKRKDSAKDFETAFRLVRQENDSLRAERDKLLGFYTEIVKELGDDRALQLIATLRAELEAVNTRYSELAAKRAKTDQLYQLALNNQEDLGKRLEAARKERDEVCKELEAQVETTHTALAAKDAAEKERNEAREVLRQIATLDCGCVPCTGQCRTGRAAEIELESRMELARAALTPAPTQEPPAGGVTISTEKKGGDEPCALKKKESTEPCSNSASNSPADVPSVGRGEWMPIETAPKDGTKILIASICGVESGYWCDKRRPMGSWVAHNGSSPRSPHSWQPLPPPPMLPTEGSGA